MTALTTPLLNFLSLVPCNQDLGQQFHISDATRSKLDTATVAILPCGIAVCSHVRAWILLDLQD
jgi:hypothetical protein